MNFLSNLFKKANDIQTNQLSTPSQVILPPEIVGGLAETQRVESPRGLAPPGREENNFSVAFKRVDEIEYRSVDNSEEMIRAIFGDFSLKIQLISKNKKGGLRSKLKFETISTNFKSNITHPGLIYYLAYCYGKKIGIVLRADMIWSCILFEFSKHISETKDKYFDDFKNIYRNENNAYYGYMTSYDLMNKFRSYIKYEEFFRLISLENFSSQPKNLMEIKIIAFSNFAKVKYKKFKINPGERVSQNIKYGDPWINCNIPKFQIKGNKEDWIKLIALIDILIHLISNRYFINYLENIKSLVSNIIMNIFHDLGEQAPQIMLSESRLRYQGIRQMIKDIFYIENEEVKGWGKELYFDSYMNSSKKWNLDDFNTHISYISYVNTKNKEACIKAGGLCYSIHDKECLEPFYGSMLSRLHDVKVFKKL